MATYPSIPDYLGADPGLASIFAALKESVEIMRGLRGSAGDAMMSRDAVLEMLTSGDPSMQRIHLGESGEVYFGLYRRVKRVGSDLLYQSYAAGAWTTTDTIAG